MFASALIVTRWFDRLVISSEAFRLSYSARLFTLHWASLSSHTDFSSLFSFLFFLLFFYKFPLVSLKTRAYIFFSFPLDLGSLTISPRSPLAQSFCGKIHTAKAVNEAGRDTACFTSFLQDFFLCFSSFLRTFFSLVFIHRTERLVRTRPIHEIALLKLNEKNATGRSTPPWCKVWKDSLAWWWVRLCNRFPRFSRDACAPHHNWPKTLIKSQQLAESHHMAASFPSRPGTRQTTTLTRVESGSTASSVLVP